MKALFVAALLAPVFAYLVRWALKRRDGDLFAALVYSTFLGEVGWIGAGLSLANALGVLVAGVVAVRLALRKRLRLELQAADYLAAATLVWTLVGAAIRGEGMEPLRAAAVVVAILLTAKLTRELSGDELGTLIRAVVLGGTVLAVLSGLQAWVDPELFGLVELPPTMIDETSSRVTGLQGNPNGAAFYLLVGVCGVVSLAAVLRHRKLELAWLAGVLVVLVTGLVLTRSRAALAASAVVVVLGAARLLRLRPAAAFALALVALLPLAIDSAPRAMLEEKLFPERPFAETGREARWSIGVSVVESEPLFGDPTVRFMHERIFYHNDVLQMAADAGLLAGALFFATLVALGWRTLRLAASDRLRPYGDFAFFVFLGSVMTSAVHGLLLGGICFWLLVGIAADRAVTRAAPRRRVPSDAPAGDVIAAGRPTARG